MFRPNILLVYEFARRKNETENLIFLSFSFLLQDDRLIVDIVRQLVKSLMVSFFHSLVSLYRLNCQDHRSLFDTNQVERRNSIQKQKLKF